MIIRWILSRWISNLGVGGEGGGFCVATELKLIALNEQTALKPEAVINTWESENCCSAKSVHLC